MLHESGVVGLGCRAHYGLQSCKLAISLVQLCCLWCQGLVSRWFRVGWGLGFGKLEEAVVLFQFCVDLLCVDLL